MTDQSSPIRDDVSLDQAVPRQSHYLTKEDVGNGVLVQISHLTMDSIENDGKTEHRAVLHFNGNLKPLVLNQTNKELLKGATGAVTAGDVKGKMIVLFNDPTIMFGGRVTGGIRIKPAPQPQAPAVPAQAPAAQAQPQGPAPGHQAQPQGPGGIPQPGNWEDDDIPY